jgi:hypothetical protein
MEMNYNDQITENMLCAKDLGEDSCQGDSGGRALYRGGWVVLTRISRACIFESRPPTIGSEK